MSVETQQAERYSGTAVRWVDRPIHVDVHIAVLLRTIEQKTRRSQRGFFGAKPRKPLDSTPLCLTTRNEKQIINIDTSPGL